MIDKSLYNSQNSLGISETLQNYIDSMVEEIVLEGKTFDSQKKYLKKFSEKEGLDYEHLEDNICTFIDIFESLKKTPNKLMEKFAIEKGRDCYISDVIITNLLDFLSPKGLFEIIDRTTGKYGFMDIDGNVIIEPHFDRVGYFDEGLALAEIDGKCGFIDQQGKEIVPFIYDDAVSYEEGMAAVRLNGKWGFVDKVGNEVVSCRYDGVGTGGSVFSQDEGFYEGVAVVELNQKRGFIDKTGKEVIPCEYDWACSFSDGLACVALNRKLMIINHDGREAFHFKYNEWNKRGEKYSEGLLGVSSNTLWGFIDKEGNEVIPCIYRGVADFHEGLAVVRFLGKMGFVDKQGNQVVPLLYEYARDFSEGLASVRVGNGYEGKYGFVDKQGNLVIPNIYDETGDFREGTAAVEKSGKWGFIDKEGSEIIPCIYDSERIDYGYIIPSFYGGLAKLSIDGKMAYIDKNSKIVWIEK